MDDELGRLLGPAASLTRVGGGVTAHQVTTHGHEAFALPWSGRYRHVGHRDHVQLPAGASWSFPALEGPGCVTALWITMAGRLRELIVRRRVPAHRHLWIKVCYDGEERPAVEAPVGLFFGNGTTRYVHFASRYVGMTSGGYYSFLPMPFERSCQITVENRHPKRPILAFLGAVTCHRLPSWPDGTGYLHTQYRAGAFRGSPEVEGSSVPDDPHTILAEARGPGSYVGQSLVIRPTHPLRSRIRPPHLLFPYLEGNLKVYLDAEVEQPGPGRIQKPAGAPAGPQAIEWTGVEDYFLAGWYYVKGAFAAPYHGCPVRSLLTGVVSQYRFHETDPYPWRQRARITLTHGEFDHVDCSMESLAYYYLGRA